MAGLVIVDSDLVIDFLRGKGPGVRLVRELVAEHRIRFSAITAFELRVGTDFHDRRPDILRLLRARTFPLDAACALSAGVVAADLRDRGQPIGFADCLQAGTCLRYELPLATRNRRHFARVAGLELINMA